MKNVAAAKVQTFSSLTDVFGLYAKFHRNSTVFNQFYWLLEWERMTDEVSLL